MLGMGLRMIKLRNGELLMATVTRKQHDYILERPLSVTIIPQTDKKGRVIEHSVMYDDWIDFSIDTHLLIPVDAVLLSLLPTQP